MISKFPGRCKGCNQPYAEGDDIHWTKETGAHCWDCIDNPKPSADQFDLAQRLGFIEYDPQMGSDGILRRMLPLDRSAATGRVESQTRGLFDSIRPMSASQKRAGTN